MMDDAAQDAVLGLSVVETRWGYVIREPRGRFDGAALAEGGLRFAGLVCGIAAYAQWLLPGSLFVGDAVLMKLVMSLVLGALAVTLYVFGNRGMRREVQVDIGAREVRFATRNGRGRARMQSCLPMDQITAVFVRRGRETGEPSRLMFRLRGQDAPILIADGTMEELDRLHERLCTDFQPPRLRLEARMAAVAAPFVSRRGAARVA